MDALDRYVAKHGGRVQSRDGDSAIVVKPKSFDPLGVVVFSVIFVLGWLTFGEMGCAVGVLPLAIYALIYVFQKDKVFEVSLDEAGEVQVRRI